MIVLTLLILGLLVTAEASAEIGLESSGGLLVLPFLTDEETEQQTFVTVTNDTDSAIELFVVVVSGDEWEDIAFSCAVTPSETTLMSIFPHPTSPGLTRLETECTELTNGSEVPQLETFDWDDGFLVVTAEDPATGVSLNTADLFGSATVVSFDQGSALHFPAWAFAGVDPAAGGLEKEFRFDGIEYAEAPKELAANFLAPVSGATTTQLLVVPIDGTAFPGNGPDAQFQINFYNDDEVAFNTLYQINCFALVSLTDIDARFESSFLGSATGHLQMQVEAVAQTNQTHDFAFDGGAGFDGLRKTPVVAWIIESSPTQSSARRLFRSVDPLLPLAGDTPVFAR